MAELEAAVVLQRYIRGSAARDTLALRRTIAKFAEIIRKGFKCPIGLLNKIAKN